VNDEPASETPAALAVSKRAEKATGFFVDAEAADRYFSRLARKKRLVETRSPHIVLSCCEPALAVRWRVSDAQRKEFCIVSRLNQKFAKLAISLAILSTGVLPVSCATRLRDAALEGVANYTTDTVTDGLEMVVPPISQFLP
jgi:hypothetical protein